LGRQSNAAIFWRSTNGINFQKTSLFEIPTAEILLCKFNLLVRGSTVEKGVVKWFNGSKGYGFISREDGDDVFVHYSAIEDTGGYRTLEEGDKVEFEVTEGPKGLQATAVRKA
jgi:CspA family cold shock protein